MTTLHHFLGGKNNTVSLLEWVLILVLHLPFLPAILLSNLPSVELQNAASTVMAFYTVLLLTKELTSQPKECDSGPMITESTGLTMFSIILK